MQTASGRARHLARTVVSRAADVAPPAAGILILAYGLFGAASPALAVAIATWVATARPAALLFRMSAGAPLRHGGAALRWSVRLLGAGAVVAAVSAVGAGFADLLSPHIMVMDVPLPAEIPNVGLFFTAGGYLAGLLLLPGAAPTLMSRFRRILDGFGVGICAFFIAWVLVFSALGMRGAALTVSLLGSIAIGGAAVAALRAARHHWIRMFAGIGAILSILGQVSLTIALDFPIASTWVLAAGLPLVLGPSLVLIGARAVLRSPTRPIPVDDDGSLAGYPVLALPLAGALLAAGYHAIQSGGFDSTAAILAIVGVSLVAVREALATIDVRRYRARLTAQKEHYRSLFAGSTDVALVLDDDLIVRWQSPAAARLLGLSDQDVVGRSLFALVRMADMDQLADLLTETTLSEGVDDLTIDEAQLRDGFGGWRDVEVRVSDLRASPEVGALVAHVRDIGDRRELERSLRRASFADQLTALPNRKELLRTITNGTEFGIVMVLCLDGVAGVNDMHGRDVGDAVLVEAARRLREQVAEGDLLIRLDGEKFAVVTIGGAIQAQLLATRLVTAVSAPYTVPNATAYVSARVGLTELGTDETGQVNADEALRRAELALRRAKRRGRGGAVEWHDESMEATVRRQLALEQELPGAIDRGELELKYQPVIDLVRQRPSGVEAVLTWRHPTLGVVSGDELLPIAESLGMGPEITEWGLHRVCRQLSSWLRDGQDLWISLDVSAEQLAGPEFVASVSIAVETHQVPAASLMVEVAESELSPQRTGRNTRHTEDPAADARDQAIIASLSDLRSLGVRVAVDHFGTSTTSLSRLRVLPVDLLKVDRELFSATVDNASPATVIIDVMVKFGHQLGVEVAVQGLTDEADVDVARAAGCQYGQGDHFSRPVPAEYLEAYLDTHRSQRF